MKTQNDCLLDTRDYNGNQVFGEKPWISIALAKSCKAKSILYKKWCNSKGTPMENLRYLEYSKYRRILRKLIAEAKIAHLKYEFERANGNIAYDVK